jgi:hypothetical protein
MVFCFRITTWISLHREKLPSRLAALLPIEAARKCTNRRQFTSFFASLRSFLVLLIEGNSVQKAVLSAPHRNEAVKLRPRRESHHTALWLPARCQLKRICTGGRMFPRHVSSDGFICAAHIPANPAMR